MIILSTNQQSKDEKDCQRSKEFFHGGRRNSRLSPWSMLYYLYNEKWSYPSFQAGMIYIDEVDIVYVLTVRDLFPVW